MDTQRYYRELARRRAEGNERAVAVSAPCPSCAAQIGEPCRASGLVAEAHTARTQLPAVQAALAALPPVTIPKPRRSSRSAPRPAARKSSQPRRRTASGGVDYLWTPEADQQPTWWLGEAPQRDVVLRENAGPVTVSLTRSAADRLFELAADSADGRETGGIALGLLPRVNEVAIVGVIEPGPRAVRTPTSLKCDGEHDVAMSNAIVREHAGQVIELGSWHTHPTSGVLRPSVADCQRGAGMLEILSAETVRLGCFVELLVGPAADGSWRRPRVAAFVTRTDPARRERYITEPAAALRGIVK